MPHLLALTRVYDNQTGDKATEKFIETYGSMAYGAINEARTNLTRGIKRKWFSGPTTGAEPKDPTMSIFGTYQLAMGCLEHDKHTTVTHWVGYTAIIWVGYTACTHLFYLVCLKVTINPVLGELTLDELRCCVNGRLRTNSAVFKMITDGFRKGGIATNRHAVHATTKFSDIVSITHEALILQVMSIMSVVLVHRCLCWFIFLLLALCCFGMTGHDKECSRKLNQRGHQWSMRTDKDAHERSQELRRIAELVQEDRAERDESAEHERLDELGQSFSDDEGSASLAQISGGLPWNIF
jgi:hypothetical protein